MFVVKITYLVGAEEVDKYVKLHRDFLDIYYKKGLFLASGPMSPRTGGIVIVGGDDKAGLEAIMKEDPYNQAGIASYEIMAFQAVKHQSEVKAYI
jgi:uncharacterized protein YciI